MMDPVAGPFADCVKGVKRGEPTIPFLSNVTGNWITADEARDPQYWARHLRQGVRFADGVKELLKDPAAIFLEVGPGTTLGSLTKFQARKADNRAILSSLRHARETEPDLALMLTTLGQLWTRGVSVDWTGFRGDEKRRRLTLPTYPFQRERYWIDRAEPSAPVAAPVCYFRPGAGDREAGDGASCAARDRKQLRGPDRGVGKDAGLNSGSSSSASRKSARTTISSTSGVTRCC